MTEVCKVFPNSLSNLKVIYAGSNTLNHPEMAFENQSTLNTVGKHTSCKLSFVYTSYMYIRYGVRAVPKFGKHASIFSYHKTKICIGHHMQRNVIVFQ